MRVALMAIGLALIIVFGVLRVDVPFRDGGLLLSVLGGVLFGWSLQELLRGAR